MTGTFINRLAFFAYTKDIQGYEADDTGYEADDTHDRFFVKLSLESFSKFSNLTCRYNM
jgi:hypothetical protein